ncbi:hypothetical protein Bhyg_04559 [Pseudolycoriella hygida]|uniref:WAP domain-containing protein n=1 Tax=Pseudolycoriella hygida TaxID=35572 RepID=A0A9Q0SA51_9DIPT|nr:hypothetical protein Bhyg_04559 [Pseudolycoriella hygida]
MKILFLLTLTIIFIMQSQYAADALMCPVPDNKVCIHYYDQCGRDADCRSDQKCCPQPGCGRECKKGVLQCPPSDPNIRCIWYHDSCTSDADCGTGKKCCLQLACGHSCKDGV